MGLISLAAGSWWYEIWISLWLLICQGIYIFIGALYQVFEKVASVNLFSVDVFTKITSRMYIVMGIAMLFIFAYNLVLMIINPDQKKGSNNQMAKMIKDTIISLTLLVLLPLIFNWMYIFQSHVLESNIIGQVILGDVGTTQGAEGGDYSKCASDDYECKCDFSQFDEIENYKGKVKILFGLISWDYNQDEKLASLERACKKYREDLTPSQRGAYSVSPTLLSAFYRPTNFNYNDCEEYLISGNSSLITNDEDKQICINFYYDVNYSKYTGNISAFSNDSYLKDIISDFDKDSMEFQWLMATVAGVLAVYMFFCYAMEIGVRVAKLGFLQLISPIPVMMKIIPQKDNMFNKWSKQLIDTYLDVFIRLIIIYFCLFAVSLVPDVMSTLLDSTNSTSGGNFLVRALASVFVILGILKFAGQAPDLFKQFFSGSGNFALKSPLKQIGENKLAMGGLGLTAGGLQNMAGNYYQTTRDSKGNKIKGSTGRGLVSAAGGFFGGARRGAEHGYKSKDFKTFKQEMKQAKYETDAARKRRIDDKQIAKDHGYDVPMLDGFIGSQIRRDNALVDYLTTDGANKVSANAASNMFNTIDAVEAKFKKAEIGTIEKNQEEIGGKIGRGESFTLNNGKQYTYDSTSKQWSDGTRNDLSNAAVRKEVADFIKAEKRRVFAESYSKNVAGIEAGMDSILGKMKDNMSALGRDFQTDLFKELNKLNNVNVSSISDLEKLIGDAIEDGKKGVTDPSKGFGLLYDVNDTLKTVSKNKSIETGFRNSIEESKTSK